jgi:hypothetical protein
MQAQEGGGCGSVLAGIAAFCIAIALIVVLGAAGAGAVLTVGVLFGPAVLVIVAVVLLILVFGNHGDGTVSRG